MELYLGSIKSVEISNITNEIGFIGDVQESSSKEFRYFLDLRYYREVRPACVNILKQQFYITSPQFRVEIVILERKEF